MMESIYIYILCIYIFDTLCKRTIENNAFLMQVKNLSVLPTVFRERHISALYKLMFVAVLLLFRETF